MTDVDLTLLGQELTAAGVPFNGLGADGGTLEGVHTWDDGDPISQIVPLPPEAAPVLAAHDASKPKRAAAFESAEDAERLRIVNERARTDPAYAALAELALRGK